MSRISFARRIYDMVAHKPSIIWSPEALDDIDRLWDYYAGIAAPIRTTN
jgi:hypothetical protein